MVCDGIPPRALCIQQPASEGNPLDVPGHMTHEITIMPEKVTATFRKL